MDKDQIAHDLAVVAAKIYVESNLPAYKTENGANRLADDLISAYSKFFKVISKHL